MSLPTQHSPQRTLGACLFCWLLLLTACAMPVPGAPTAEATAVPTASPATEEISLFPLTITDAAGQEFTFDAPPKIGCWWTGCIEVLADLGLPAQAASTWLAEGYDSTLFFPAGPPVHEIQDSANPEEWAASEVDLLIMRLPVSPNYDALAAAAPIFYLHAPSYGESAQTGYEAYLENLRLGGQLTGQPAAAAAAIARFETMMANLKQLATPETQAQAVAILWEDEAYRAVDNTNPFCTIIGEAGLGTCIEAPLWDEISPEAFLAADPDVILYMSGSDQHQERTDPVWSQLTAVKEGHVYGVTGLFYCCGARTMYHDVHEYIHLILPDALPDPGPFAAYDPEKSPLVQPADDTTSNTDASSTTSGTHTVEHELGVTEAPVNPQRIVALHDLSIANNMIQLGVVPIGSANREDARAIGDFVLPDTVAPVGSIPEPNLEQIAALQPDLIICLNTHAEIYDQLATLAPTVAVRDYSAEDALAAQRTVADLIGKTDLFNAQVAAYEARVAELRERLAPRQERLEVVAVGIYGENLYLTQQIGWTHAKVFADLGLTTPPTIAELIGDAEDQSASVSYEELPQLDADVIFLIDPAWEGGLQKLQATGLLDLTFAGKAGQIFTVDANHWYRGGIAGLNLVLDDIEQLLLAQELDTSGNFR